MNQISYQKWEVQLRKGFLELCVLRSLSYCGRAYGGQLLQQLKDVGVEVNEGTLYPLLNRMYKNGWLESEWETQTDSGHPRRFYSLSELGRDLLPAMLKAYQRNTQSIELMEKSS